MVFVKKKKKKRTCATWSCTLFKCKIFSIDVIGSVWLWLKDSVVGVSKRYDGSFHSFLVLLFSTFKCKACTILIGHLSKGSVTQPCPPSCTYNAIPPPPLHKSQQNGHCLVLKSLKRPFHSQRSIASPPGRGGGDINYCSDQVDKIVSVGKWQWQLASLSLCTGNHLVYIKARELNMPDVQSAHAVLNPETVTN